MANQKKKRKHFTFMIVPHDAQGHPISFKLPAVWLYGAVFALIFCVLLAGSSVVYSTLISRRLVGYSQALNQNEKQEATIVTFSQKTEEIMGTINKLVSEENNLRRMLGLKSWRSQARLPFDQISSPEAKDKISNDLQKMTLQLVERKKSLDELKAWVKQVQDRLAQTPTSWPIYGRITSGYGYRTSPWRGMHKGIDIQADYGAPARATASGLVVETGWIRGYGKTVVVQHENGLTTLYGHCSGYAVSVGQKVNKNQIICYVGMTGWTTGPHLHYEVRKYEAAQNPMAYLDMNVVTASRMWRE
ncbi:MAG: M23 family metallopeptidase [Candidatus Margulisiibacteriota bacterium]